MAESSPVNSPNQSRRESRENNNDNVDSPISPVSPPSAPYEAQSLLSDLLQKGNTYERQPLIKRHKSKDYHSTHHQHHDSNTSDDDPELGHQQESVLHPVDRRYSFNNTKSKSKESNCMSFSQLRKKLRNPKDWVDCFTQPISYIPAVILGLLLNLLDAISYGMITFPLNNPIFASFGPDGISMFFVR